MRSEGFTVSFANGREMRFGGEDEESPDFELEFDSQDSVVTDLDGDDEPESYPCTNLSVVLTFPLDVIFEIFAHLDHADLLILSRSNKDLRSIMMSQCPDDVSELLWANLFFGGSMCQECDLARVPMHKIKFTLRRRLCIACTKAKVVDEQSLIFDRVDCDIFELIPEMTAELPDDFTDGRCYWSKDFDRIEKELMVYRLNVALDRPGAKQALGAFKNERINFVKAITKHAEMCQSWAAKIRIRSRDERQAKIQLRYDDIKARFHDLGYLVDDVECIANQPQVRNTHKLTDRGWESVRRMLEPIVEKYKLDRIAEERSRILSSRAKQVIDLYEEAFLVLGTNIPKPSGLLEFKPLSKLICMDSDRDLEEGEVMDAMGELFAYMQKCIRMTRGNLASSLPTMAVPKLGEPDRLSLATSIFACAVPLCLRREGALVAHDALFHECTIGAGFRLTESKLEFSECGSAAAASLITKLGLDVQTAVPADLDVLNVAVWCQDCVKYYSKDVKLFTWLEYVTHCMTLWCSHSIPNWSRDLAIKKFHCIHCNGAGIKPRKFRADGIHNHLRAKHKICGPLEGHDMVVIDE